MNSIAKVCETVARRVTPRADERRRVVTIADRLRQRVDALAREAHVEAEVRLDGSVAKDTWLRGAADLDIFMRLPATLAREELEKKGLQIARRAVAGFPAVERFAEHPYIEATVNGTLVNIVPCYKVERGKWLSATDRTPFHTEYVKAHLDEPGRGEVRLLKAFMKGVGAYGADIKVGGFSGMLCETLIINYHSFLRTLQAAQDWRHGHLIDPEGYYAGRVGEARQLFEDPLIAIDPVDKGRNLAASVTPRRAWELVSASRAFNTKPSTRFFFPPKQAPIGAAQLKRQAKARLYNLIGIEFGRVDAVVDVLWSQLYKSERALVNLLSQAGFDVLKSASWSDESDLNIILLELASSTLSTVKKHIGPEVSRRAESDKFLQKHLGAPDTLCGPWIENSRWIVEKARKRTVAREVLSEALADGGRGIGVADKIAKAVRDRHRIVHGGALLKLISSRRDFAIFLSEFVRGRPAWLE